jgi:hypothetical protein
VLSGLFPLIPTSSKPKFDLFAVLTSTSLDLSSSKELSEIIG